MIDMFLNYSKLFFRGKLFRDSRQVLRQWLIGFAAALVAVLLLTKAGVPLWLTIAIVALAVGALQPWLFKDLKYN